MIRGTTATFKFQLPYPFDSLTSVKIVFWQEETKTTIIKEKTNCFEGSSPNELCVSLSPDDTLRFSEEYKAKAQFKGELVKNKDVMSFASKEYLISVHPIYKGSDVQDFEIDSKDREVILDGGGIGGDS